jgi:glyoxylase-like metal-dependent hydrolase (beta-lactamase superfamily II)
MSMEITRLHLASLAGIDGGRWPVHGFVITHPGGAVLVDTGVGGPPDMLDDWRVVNRSVADALAELDMSPADIGLVINTHLHFDHCGQNAVFRHAPVYVQRAELSRAKRESPELCEWFDFMNARFELLDGDAEVLPGLEVIATPGHTEGHQCVVVRGDQDGPGGSGGRGLHTTAVRSSGPRQAPGRAGQRRPGVAGVGTAGPVAAPGPRSFLPSHRYRAQLMYSG